MSKKKITWTLEKRKLEQLNPYEHNPRKLTEKGMADLKKSIDKFGLAEPIIINTDNTIIGGHARYFTLLKDKNILFADCYVPDITLTPEEVKELNIRLNKNIAGEFDLDILAAAFEFDKLVDWGFAEDELDASKWGVQKTEEELDDVPEPQKEAVSKFGDIFLLDGKHRVMCGDSTKKEDVEILMNGQRADMVFTDPPYRMVVEGGFNQWVGKQSRKVGESIKDLVDFEPMDWINTLPLYFGGEMNAYIFCNKDLVPDYLNWARKNKYNFNILFWKKPNALPLGGSHRPDVEYLIVIRKNAIWNNAIQGVSYSKSLEFGRENSTPHPTMKPVELIVNELKISSNIGGIVVDDFLGSGSTLIACEQINRICYGMEIDPIYIDVILRRYYNLYPEKRIECLTRKDFNFSDLFKTDAKN